jgi:hypothetical protein
MKYWEICRKSKYRSNLSRSEPKLMLALQNSGHAIFASCDLIGLEVDLNFWDHPTQWLFRKGSIEYGYNQKWSPLDEYMRLISDVNNKVSKVAIRSERVNPNLLVSGNNEDIYSDLWIGVFELRINITYLFFDFGNMVSVRGLLK